MTTADFLDLNAYNVWANGRILAAAESLSDDAWSRDLGGSFPTLAATLAHIVSSEQVWTQRFMGTTPTTRPAWIEHASPSVVRRELADVERTRSAWLDTLTDDELHRLRPFTLLNGMTSVQTLRDTFLHAVNHSTYHRGQAAAMIRMLGGTAPATDYFVYAAAARPSSAPAFAQPLS